MRTNMTSCPPHDLVISATGIGICNKCLIRSDPPSQHATTGMDIYHFLLFITYSG